MKAGQEKKTERICPVCGKTYTDKRANTCGKSCGAKARLSRVTETCVCAYCGKVTPKTTGRKKYCSKNCKDKAGKERKLAQSQVEKAKEARETELVHIRIEREVGVEPDMQPEVGKVYRAKKIPGKTGFSYLIPGIGKYGLLVRDKECVEV